MTEGFFLAEMPQLKMIRDIALRNCCLATWQKAFEEGEHTEETLLRQLAHKKRAGCSITLLEHTRVVTNMAICMAEQLASDLGPFFPVSMDVLIAGSLLHDVGKALVQDHTPPDSKYAFIHHSLAGALLAERCSCPWEVVHIIANHSALEVQNVTDTPELYVVRAADEFYFGCVKFKCEKKEV